MKKLIGGTIDLKKLHRMLENDLSRACLDRQRRKLKSETRISAISDLSDGKWTV